MKLGTILGLIGSIYFLVYLEGILFWIYLVGALIYHLRIALAFARSYEDIENDKKLYRKKWKIGSNFENILFFMIPLLAVFKGWILVNKKRSLLYGQKTNWVIILISVILLYIYDTNGLLLLFSVIHFSSTILFVKYVLKEKDLDEDNLLIVFTVYALPITYILVFIYRIFESAFMYCTKNEA